MYFDTSRKGIKGEKHFYERITSLTMFEVKSKLSADFGKYQKKVMNYHIFPVTIPSTINVIFSE